ncbi:MAG: hypothetical protein ACREJO_13560 [Phycisphaerales bacterium]
MRGLVAPALESEAGTPGIVLERYDYTPFGRPIAQPPGDVNGDVQVSDDGYAIDHAATAQSCTSTCPRAVRGHFRY